MAVPKFPQLVKIQTVDHPTTDSVFRGKKYIYDKTISQQTQTAACQDNDRKGQNTG